MSDSETPKDESAAGEAEATEAGATKAAPPDDASPEGEAVSSDGEQQTAKAGSRVDPDAETTKLTAKDGVDPEAETQSIYASPSKPAEDNKQAASAGPAPVEDAFKSAPAADDKPAPAADSSIKANTDTQAAQAPVVTGGAPSRPRALEGSDSNPDDAIAARLSSDALGTRIVGLCWALLAITLGGFLIQRVFNHDFGTTNARLLSVIRACAVAVTAYPALLGLYALGTGRTPPAKANPFGVPFRLGWFDALLALTGRELKRVFLHPVAFIVLFCFLLINGLLMSSLIEYYSSFTRTSFQAPPIYFMCNNPLLWLSLILICPALTMRLIAEERQHRSLEMLLTAPITEAQVVLSKFLCAFAYFTFMVLASLAYVFLIQSYASEWDWGPVFSGYVGLLLIGCLFCAIGTWTSSMTKSQIVAFLISAVILMFLAILGQVIPRSGLDEAVKDVLGYVTISGHQDEFASGVFRWRAFVFYLSTSVYFLYLAKRGVAAQAWR